MYCLYVDARMGAHLSALLEVLPKLENSRVNSAPLTQWLLSCGIDMDKGAASFTVSAQNINWDEAPLTPWCLRLLQELLTMDSVPLDDQARLALILCNLDFLGLKEMFLAPLPIGNNPKSLSFLEGQIGTFSVAETSPSFALLAKKIGKSLDVGSKVILRRWAQSNLGLTAYLFEFAQPEEGQVAVLNFQVDDMNPEILGYLQTRALELGALDYFTTPVQMKKNRPGTLITILSLPETKRRFIDLIFQETSTIGIRYHFESRATAARKIISLPTSYGIVRVKVSSWVDSNGNVLVQNSPEFDDCRQLAQNAGVPLKQIYELALQQLRQS